MLVVLRWLERQRENCVGVNQAAHLENGLVHKQKMELLGVAAGGTNCLEASVVMKFIAQTDGLHVLMPMI